MTVVVVLSRTEHAFCVAVHDLEQARSSLRATCTWSCSELCLPLTELLLLAFLLLPWRTTSPCAGDGEYFSPHLVILIFCSAQNRSFSTHNNIAGHLLLTLLTTKQPLSHRCSHPLIISKVARCRLSHSSDPHHRSEAAIVFTKEPETRRHHNNRTLNIPTWRRKSMAHTSCSRHLRTSVPNTSTTVQKARRWTAKL